MPRRKSNWKQIIVFAALTLALTACGDESSSDSASAPTATETAAPDTKALEDRIAELEAEADEKEAKARKAAREKKRRERERRERARREREAQEAEPAPEPEQTSGGGITVPDVTGLDHQAAQDALQGEGLWSLDEEDATGQDRLLLFDRNWEVVKTDPPAGSQVSEDTTITIYSKKQGE
jgi:hypothetical protein